MNRFLSRETSVKLLHKIQANSLPFTYDDEKHRVNLLDEQDKELVHFRLPLPLSSPENISKNETQQVNYVVLLIQAGHCAMGYFENGGNLNHKVFTSYMVRMKQGVSQIKYLKTKGKSRAGSRVRLGETVEFFENINGRLQEYFTKHQIHRIAFSCSKTLLPYLFDSNVETPFDKCDPRIFRIPKHVNTPKHEVLLDVNKFLMKGELIYEPLHQGFVDELLEDTLS